MLRISQKDDRSNQSILSNLDITAPLQSSALHTKRLKLQYFGRDAGEQSVY